MASRVAEVMFGPAVWLSRLMTERSTLPLLSGAAIGQLRLVAGGRAAQRTHRLGTTTPHAAGLAARGILVYCLKAQRRHVLGVHSTTPAHAVTWVLPGPCPGNNTNGGGGLLDTLRGTVPASNGERHGAWCEDGPKQRRYVLVFFLSSAFGRPHQGREGKHRDSGHMSCQELVSGSQRAFSFEGQRRGGDLFRPG